MTKNEGTNQWKQYGGCGVYIPEGYDGTLDVIVYCPGAGGGNANGKIGGQIGADTIPYQELIQTNPDKIIIYDNSIGGTYINDIVSALQQIDSQDNITVGAIDVNAHSAGDKGSIRTSIALDEAGFTVANVNVFDGDSTLHMCEYKDAHAVTSSEWQQFAETGATLNVFSRGQAVNTWMEQDRLTNVASTFGIPATYTICEFEGNRDWGELHAALNRDLVVNGFMDVFDGKTDSVSFTVRLTEDDYPGQIAPRPAYVTGFISSESFDPETNQWTITYTKAEDGTDISGMISSLSRNAYLYSGMAEATTLIGDANNELNRMLTQINASNLDGAIGSLPSRDNLLVYKDELSAFLSSQSLSALVTDTEDANALNGVLANFVGNNILIGDIWNLAYQKIGVYDTRINERIQTAMELESTLRSAVSTLLNSMGEYSKLNTSDLDALKELSRQLEAQISSLKAQIAAAEAAEQDTSGLVAALRKVESDKIEVDKEITAIENLQAAYDQVRPSIEAAIGKVAEFSSKVSSITPSQAYTYVA